MKSRVGVVMMKEKEMRNGAPKVELQKFSSCSGASLDRCPMIGTLAG